MRVRESVGTDALRQPLKPGRCKREASPPGDALPSQAAAKALVGARRNRRSRCLTSQRGRGQKG